MDRHTIAATFFVALLPIGGSAVIGAATVGNSSPYFAYLLWGGIAAIFAGVAALGGLFLFPGRKGERERVRFPRGVFIAEDGSVIEGGDVRFEDMKTGPFATATKGSRIGFDSFEARNSEIGTGAMGDTYHNSGNNYGHMGPVNIGRQPFVLTQQHIDGMLRTFPQDRTATITVVGGPEAAAMGDRIQESLLKAGIKVTNRTNAQHYAPMPAHPFVGTDDGTQVHIILAPDA